MHIYDLSKMILWLIIETSFIACFSFSYKNTKSQYEN